MGADRNKSIVAAISGVQAYIRSQEEQELALAAERPAPPPPAAAVSLWPASGRQAIMDMRRLLQLRMVR